MTSRNRSLRITALGRRPWTVGSAGNPGWLTALVPVAISLVSLALSVYTIIEANREPQIWLSPPVFVKLAMKPAYAVPWDTGVRPRFFVQPRLVSTARNDRVVAISDLQLEVAPPGGGPPLPFTWMEQGTWQYEPESGTETYLKLADPAPLVVSPTSPQLPICLFVGPPDWRWQPGTYTVTIVASRSDGGFPVRAAFTMTVSAEQAAFVTAPGFLYYVVVESHAATPVAS